MARRSGYESGELPDAAVHVMLALVQPRHGYAVMQFLDQESGGAITLGPASLYTTLKKLSSAELIHELGGEASRRVYQLTPTGREVLIRNIERRRQLISMADHLLEDA